MLRDVPIQLALDIGSDLFRVTTYQGFKYVSSYLQLALGFNGLFGKWATNSLVNIGRLVLMALRLLL